MSVNWLDFPFELTWSPRGDQKGLARASTFLLGGVFLTWVTLQEGSSSSPPPPDSPPGSPENPPPGGPDWKKWFLLLVGAAVTTAAVVWVFWESPPPPSGGEVIPFETPPSVVAPLVGSVVAPLVGSVVAPLVGSVVAPVEPFVTPMEETLSKAFLENFWTLTENSMKKLRLAEVILAAERSGLTPAEEVELIRRVGDTRVSSRIFNHLLQYHLDLPSWEEITDPERTMKYEALRHANLLVDKLAKGLVYQRGTPYQAFHGFNPQNVDLFCRTYWVFTGFFVEGHSQVIQELGLTKPQIIQLVKLANSTLWDPQQFSYLLSLPEGTPRRTANYYAEEKLNLLVRRVVFRDSSNG